MQRNNKSLVRDGKIGRTATLIFQKYVDPSYAKEVIVNINIDKTAIGTGANHGINGFN